VNLRLAQAGLYALGAGLSREAEKRGEYVNY
jgi:hypothetical protein